MNQHRTRVIVLCVLSVIDANLTIGTIMQFIYNARHFGGGTL